MENKDVFILNWQGYEIEASHLRSYSKAFEKAYGYGMSHIEVKTIAPQGAALRVTDTGYRSIFTDELSVKSAGGVKRFVIDGWRVARSTSWKAQHEAQEQY